VAGTLRGFFSVDASFCLQAELAAPPNGSFGVWRLRGTLRLEDCRLQTLKNVGFAAVQSPGTSDFEWKKARKLRDFRAFFHAIFAFYLQRAKKSVKILAKNSIDL
jgi:hypothetical protein